MKQHERLDFALVNLSYDGGRCQENRLGLCLIMSSSYMNAEALQSISVSDREIFWQSTGNAPQMNHVYVSYKGTEISDKMHIKASGFLFEIV